MGAYVKRWRRSGKAQLAVVLVLLVVVLAAARLQAEWGPRLSSISEAEIAALQALTDPDPEADPEADPATEPQADPEATSESAAQPEPQTPKADKPKAAEPKQPQAGKPKPTAPVAEEEPEDPEAAARKQALKEAAARAMRRVQEREQAQAAEEAANAATQPTQQPRPAATAAQPEAEAAQPKSAAAQPTADAPQKENMAAGAEDESDDTVTLRRRTPQPKQLLENVFDSIDPTMFNLSGAELKVEVVGDTVILQGSEEDLMMLETLVSMLDTTREAKVLEVVEVKQRDGNDVARSVQDALQEVFKTANQRPEDEVAITALSSQVLLVSALPEQIDFVVDVIRRVDQVPPSIGKVEQMVFPIENRKASAVAVQLQEIIDKIREKQGGGPETEIQVIPNDANNSLIVIAPETDRETIEGLLAEIDVAPVKGWGEIKLTLFPLIHSEANNLADVIEELLAAKESREEVEEVIRRLIISKASPSGEIVELPPINLERTVRIIPNEETNSLIVATAEENVEPMGELIRLLDDVPTAEAMGLQLFPLQFADASTLADLISEMFESGKDLPDEADGSDVGAVPEGAIGSSLVYNISIQADERTNTLVASGRQEQLILVRMMVEELDVPARALKFPLQMMPLKYADATTVANVINSLVEQRIDAISNTNAGEAAIERERVFLTVDVRGNALILSASDDNVGEIADMVAKLDIKADSVFDKIRLVPCGRLSATDLKSKIDELWERKNQLRQEAELPEDTPVLIADERSNALLVASSLEDFEEITNLVETLSSQPMIEATRLFVIEHADAVAMKGMLDELFDGMASATESDAFQAPTIVPDPRANVLVVAGGQDVMERVEDLVSRLDVEAGARTTTFAAYPLEHTAAARLSGQMQELFDNRASASEVEATPVVVLAEESSNSLIAMASRDDHKVIKDMLKLLDKPSTLAANFELFPLLHARADAVAETMNNLFAAQADNSTGEAHALGVEADTRTNALLVWASPSEMANIREMIHKLDTAEPTRNHMVKIIKLEHARAEDFASLLEDTLLSTEGGSDDEAVIISFMTKDKDGNAVERQLLRQDIQITADRRTNSLMVRAPRESINMLEAMILDFDRIRPVTSEIALFKLVNHDADSMVEQLTTLFEEGTAGDSEVESQLVFSGLGDFDFSSVGQTLRFTADRRTNTVIAAGAEVDLRMVEELINILDSQDTEERVNQVYRARFRGADEIANAIRNFNDQEQDPFSDIDDETSQMRRAERMISVEAIGDEETSNSVLLGVSPRYQDQVLRLIDEIDRPEPQVMIRVLIAEVTLQDDVSLGIEMVGQDLRFSENAVLGPNGIVQGSDFDYVLGTALGAAQGLGLNFTMTGEDFSFLLNALQTDSRLEVLSRPVMMIQNGSEGEISIGDEIPVITGTDITQGTTTSTIGRERVGIVLTAKPQVSPDGYVTIEISQEISNFSGDQIQLSEGLSNPVIGERQVQTNVTLRDGETVVIGGLIQQRESSGDTKVPLLGDIPVLGALFRTSSVTSVKNELLIVLNVNVIRTHEDRKYFSEEELHRFHLSDRIRRNPLMEGLRIRPDQNLLGPEDGTKGTPTPPRTQPGQEFGPETPRTYGPPIPTDAERTTAQAGSGKRAAHAGKHVKIGGTFAPPPLSEVELANRDNN
jgi:type II secretion system protein D